jgi:hypothetical protein
VNRAIRIHSLEHARAALDAAGGHPVTLVSPPSAASFPGIGWWRQLVAAARQEFPDARFDAALDCGPATGMALAALRTGCGPVWVQTDAMVLAKLADMAEQVGTRAEYGGNALDLLGMSEPRQCCRDWLGT